MRTTDRPLLPAILDGEARAKASALKVLALATTFTALGYVLVMAFIPAVRLSATMNLALGGALIISLGCHWLARQAWEIVMRDNRAMELTGARAGKTSEPLAGAVRAIKTGVDRRVVGSARIDAMVCSLRALAERLA